VESRVSEGDKTVTVWGGSITDVEGFFVEEGRFEVVGEDLV
jgi:hypothetical protein